MNEQRKTVTHIGNGGNKEHNNSGDVDHKNASQ